MAWNDAKVTRAGTDMLNELLAGRTLTITAAFSGTETVDSDLLDSQTDVSGDKHRLNVVGVKNADEGKTVRVQANNEGVTEAFTMKQVGVFAVLDKDLPTEEAARMLFVMQDQRGADVPTQADNPMFVLDMYCIIAISNEVQFHVTVDAAGIVTVELLTDVMADHNADPTAHPDMRAAIAQAASGGGAPAYSDESPYTAGDYCTRGGKLYKCIADIAAPEVWTPEHWRETTITEELEEIAKAAAGGSAASYSDTETYAVGDFCEKDGKLYKCVSAITTPEAWTAAHWQETKITDELAAAAQAAAGGGAEEYSDAKTYAAGDYCTRDGKLYKCVDAITAPETWTAAHWQETSIAAELTGAWQAAEEAGESSFAPTIIVTAFDGDTVTCTKGATTMEKTVAGETCTFKVTGFGEWTVTATHDSKTVSKTIDVQAVTDYAINLKFFRYGFRVKKSESQPAGRVEYILDAVGMTPAHMDFATGRFDYGSWADAWFVRENYPCMLYSNGLEAYKLNPNDYSKKDNGQASDVANTSFDGNAMSAIPLCWVKRYEEDGYQYVIICNGQYDDTYKAYAHMDASGRVKPYAYHAMFEGSTIDSKLRSLSGQRPESSTTAEQEITQATANGAGWNIRTHSLNQLIADLCTLIAKSDNSQEAFGQGHDTGGSQASHMLTTGGLNDKGQFYGTNTNAAVKVFHCENFYADRWERIVGLILDNGVYKVKMTPDYNLTGDGYTTVNTTTLSGKNGGYIIDSKMTEYGRLPQGNIAGSDATYECDGCWYNNGIVAVAFVGGACNNGSLCGLRYLDVAAAASYADWNLGASLSYVNPS